MSDSFNDDLFPPDLLSPDLLSPEFFSPEFFPASKLVHRSLCCDACQRHLNLLGTIIQSSRHQLLALQKKLLKSHGIAYQSQKSIYFRLLENGQRVEVEKETHLLVEWLMESKRDIIKQYSLFIRLQKVLSALAFLELSVLESTEAESLRGKAKKWGKSREVW